MVDPQIRIQRGDRNHSRPHGANHIADEPVIGGHDHIARRGTPGRLISSAFDQVIGRLLLGAKHNPHPVNDALGGRAFRLMGVENNRHIEISVDRMFG